ncbi:hypothetical protein Bca4012_049401 [Brassica carinata]
MDKSEQLLKPWKPPWEERLEDEVSLFYGDILTIAENWSSQFIIFVVKSVHWILNHKLFIVLNWDEINVIQQRKLAFMMRGRSKVCKKINRVDTLVIKKIS